MLRTIVYLRKSSKDSDENKQYNSLPRQRREIEEFAKKHNTTADPEDRLVFSEDDIFEEDASAKVPGRKVFGEIIEKIKKRKYDVLLCTDLSRLSRNPIDTWMLTYILDREDLQQIRTTDKIFWVIPTDKFTFSLFLSVAKYENDQRAVNTVSGMDSRKSQGATTNKAPMGYINNPDGRKKGQKEVWPDKDNDNYNRIKNIWKLMLTGNYTISQLYKIGCEQWITIISEGSRVLPSESTYRGMFANIYYAWFIAIKNKKTKIIEELEPWNHPAMVSREEFDAVQIILQKRGFKHSKPLEAINYDNILKELLVCGKSKVNMYIDIKTRYTCWYCRHRFSAVQIKPCPQCSHELTKNDIAKREQRRYYVCPKDIEHTYTYKGNTKTARNIPAEYIEGLVDDQIRRVSISEDMFQVLKRQLYTIWLEKNDDITKEKKRLRKEVEKTEEDRRDIRESSLKKGKVVDDTEREDVEHLIKTKQKTINDLNKKIAELDEKIEEDFDIAWEALNVMLETKKVFGGRDQKSLEPKRRLLLSLCTNQKFTDWKIEIEWRKPYGMMLTTKLTKQKSQVNPEISDFDSKWLPE